MYCSVKYILLYFTLSATAVKRDIYCHGIPLVVTYHLLHKLLSKFIDKTCICRAWVKKLRKYLAYNRRFLQSSRKLSCNLTNAKLYSTERVVESLKCHKQASSHTCY